MTVYLSFDQLVGLHEELLHSFGGASGLRERSGLESAVARPAMTFGGEDLYPDLASKMAALMHSLVLNHPFVDGNKRLSVSAAELLADLNGHVIAASDEELEVLTIDVATGRMEVEALAIWFRQRLRPLE